MGDKGDPGERSSPSRRHVFGFPANEQIDLRIRDGVSDVKEEYVDSGVSQHLQVLALDPGVVGEEVAYSRFAPPVEGVDGA